MALAGTVILAATHLTAVFELTRITTVAFAFLECMACAQAASLRQSSTSTTAAFAFVFLARVGSKDTGELKRLGNSSELYPETVLGTMLVKASSMLTLS